MAASIRTDVDLGHAYFGGESGNRGRFQFVAGVERHLNNYSEGDRGIKQVPNTTGRRSVRHFYLALGSPGLHYLNLLVTDNCSTPISGGSRKSKKTVEGTAAVTRWVIHGSQFDVGIGTGLVQVGDSINDVSHLQMTPDPSTSSGNRPRTAGRPVGQCKTFCKVNFTQRLPKN